MAGLIAVATSQCIIPMLFRHPQTILVVCFLP
jgi:hypothetical protein